MDQSNEFMTTPQKKKGGVLKWILIGCGSLILIAAIIIGIAAYVYFRTVAVNDPVKVDAVAQEILSFDKPHGFSGKFSMNMGFMKMVMFIGTDGAEQGSVLLLASFPSGSSQEDAQKQMLDAMEQRSGGKMSIAERRPREIFRAQGKEVEAACNLAQQSGDSEPRVLQYMMTLHGISGKPVMLMLIGSKELITHEWVQQFLDTVKSPIADK